jgi:hypothetical protein
LSTDTSGNALASLPAERDAVTRQPNTARRRTRRFAGLGVHNVKEQD